MRARFIIFIFLFELTSLYGQAIDDVYGWASEIAEALSEESDDEDFSYLIEDIVRIYNNPIDINHATRQDLEKIVFLNAIQIENLLFQRYTNGAFGSIYDLQNVEGFDRRLLEWLEPLIVFGEMDSRQKKIRPRGDLFLRTRFTIETPAGYKPSGEDLPVFQGDKPLLYSRFEMSITRDLEAGFVTENDPGEPMFNSQISTMDHLAGYVSWKPGKFLKQVIVGQYRISGGQGLALQSGMSTRKSSLTTCIQNRSNTYRPSLSVNEYSGLSGLLLSLGNQNFSVTPFVSIRNRDGRIVEGAEGKVITGFDADGYHRTLTELSSRKNTREDVFGVQVKYFFKRLTIEAGHLEYRIEYPLTPSALPSKRFYFSGQENHNSWFALEGSIGNTFVFSEVAFNNSMEPALWGGLLFSPGAPVSMVLSYRRIPVDFNAPLGGPFTESSGAAGESGFYSGIQINFPANFLLSGYLDYFKFNWLQYQLKSPANGYDVLAILTHKAGLIWENSLRLRHREKMVNLSSEGPDYPIGVRKQNQIRLQTRFNPVPEWSFTTRLDFHQVAIPGKTIPSGFYLGQEIRYNHPGNKWNVIMRYGIIDVEDFETRIYVYEPDVLYSLTTPAYYGQGSRCIVMSKIKIANRLDLWARFAWWHYTNRENISSGNMLIDSNVVREFRVQIRKRF